MTDTISPNINHRGHLACFSEYNRSSSFASTCVLVKGQVRFFQTLFTAVISLAWNDKYEVCHGHLACFSEYNRSSSFASACILVEGNVTDAIYPNIIHLSCFSEHNWFSFFRDSIVSTWLMRQYSFAQPPEKWNKEFSELIRTTVPPILNIIHFDLGETVNLAVNLDLDWVGFFQLNLSFKIFLNHWVQLVNSLKSAAF